MLYDRKNDCTITAKQVMELPNKYLKASITRYVDIWISSPQADMIADLYTVTKLIT
jgi:hypothetical protein